MKKILIFGANGAIGRYMVDYFYERRHEYGISLVTADLDSCPFIEERSEFYKVNISKKEEFEKLPKDIYAAINLATVMTARVIGDNQRPYIETNIGGTFNLLEFCKDNQVNRFVFAQTCGDIHYYDEKELYLKVGMLPVTRYGENKALYITSMNTCVEMTKCYHAMYNMRTFIFRLPTIYLWNTVPYYENGQMSKEGYRILIDKAIKGEDIYVWGDPNRKKDMVYVKDLCQEFYRACFVDRDYGFYNIGTGVGTTLLDQIKGIVEVFCGEKKSKILFAPEKRNAPQYIMDIIEAVDQLEYQPRYYYIDMLKDMKKEMELNRLGN